jgi:hypothetical protein
VAEVEELAAAEGSRAAVGAEVVVGRREVAADAVVGEEEEPLEGSRRVLRARGNMSDGERGKRRRKVTISRHLLISSLGLDKLVIHLS